MRYSLISCVLLIQFSPGLEKLLCNVKISQNANRQDMLLFIFPKKKSQWESGANSFGKRKCLCSESTSNGLAANEASGQASVHAGEAALHRKYGFYVEQQATKDARKTGYFLCSKKRKKNDGI